MKIISLVDDISTNSNLISEHGLSFYIEAASKKYLFDTGASDAFLHNANSIGLNIKEIDALFLSHNHYDHIGGLLHFMDINKKAKIYIKEDAVYETFYQVNDFKCYVGQYHKELLLSNRIVFVKNSMRVNNIYLVSDTTGKKDYFCQGSTFYIDKNNEIKKDNFTHEMFLVYIKDNKVNIISACSHRGIVNIIETTKTKFNLPINSIIAGFHLSAKGGKSINCTNEYYERLVEYFKDNNLKNLYTCHCTGKYPYEKLKHDLNDNINYFYIGNEVNI